MEGTIAAIKKIIDVYTAEDGLKYFRIAWKDTWEPELHLISCQDAIDEFWKQRCRNNEADKKSDQKDYRDFECQTQSRIKQYHTTSSIQCNSINTTTSVQRISQKSEYSANNIPSEHCDSPLPNRIRSSCKGNSRKYIESSVQCEILKDTVCKSISTQCNTFSEIYKHEVDVSNVGDVETCDIECQHEYNSRDFAAQQQPFTTDIGLHVRPSICSRSIQVNVCSTTNAVKHKSEKVSSNAMTQYEKNWFCFDAATQCKEEVIRRDSSTQFVGQSVDSSTQYEIFSKNQGCQHTNNLCEIGIQCNFDDTSVFCHEHLSARAVLIETEVEDGCVRKEDKSHTAAELYSAKSTLTESNESCSHINSIVESDNTEITKLSTPINVETPVNNDFLLEAASPDTTTLTLEKACADEQPDYVNRILFQPLTLIKRQPYTSIDSACTSSDNIIPHSEEVQNLLKGHYIDTVDKQRLKQMYFLTENPLLGVTSNVKAKPSKRGRKRNISVSGNIKRKKLSSTNEELCLNSYQTIIPRPLFVEQTSIMGGNNPLQSLVELSKSAGSIGNRLTSDSSKVNCNQLNNMSYGITYITPVPESGIAEETDKSTADDLRCTSPYVYSNASSPVDSQGIRLVSFSTMNNQLINTEVQLDNGLNESLASTVYDPNSPASQKYATACEADLNKSDLPRKEIVSLRMEEKGINEDFISKYWK